MNQKQTLADVEAMLFACGDPIASDKLAQAVQLPQSTVETALEALHTRYQREDSGLCLLHLIPGGNLPPRPSGRTVCAACWTAAALCRLALRPWRP